MKETVVILNNQSEFLKFLKSRFIMFHNSNFFFRDFHYGTMFFLKEHGTRSSYHIAEDVTKEIVAVFESNGIFKKIDHQSWTLNYPEFSSTKVEKKATTAN